MASQTGVYSLTVFLSNKFRPAGSKSPWHFRPLSLPNLSDRSYGGNTGQMVGRVTQVSFQNRMHNIASGQSNELRYKVNGVEYFTAIQSGYYDVYALVDSLNTAMNALGLTWAYDYNSKKLNVTIGVGVTFTPLGAVVDTTLGEYRPWLYSPIERLWSMMGFTRLLGLTFTNQVLLGLDAVNLSDVHCLYLCMTGGLVNSVSLDRQHPPVLISIPIAGGGFGDDVTFIPMNPPFFNVDLSQMTSLDLYIEDNYGNQPVVDDNTGLCVTMVLEQIQAPGGLDQPNDSQ
jgi:hypothetical protein